MHRQLVSRLCLTGFAVALGWASWWTFGKWRFQAGLRQAKAELAAGRFDAAHRWLAVQSVGGLEHSEAAYLLGVCEQALECPESAAAAYGRVPPAAPRGVDAALAAPRC